MSSEFAGGLFERAINLQEQSTLGGEAMILCVAARAGGPVKLTRVRRQSGRVVHWKKPIFGMAQDRLENWGRARDKYGSNWMGHG